MKNSWTPEKIAETKTRIEYKNRVAEHSERVTHYVKNYYFTQPWRNLDPLTTECIKLIHIAIQRDYKSFLFEAGNDFWDTLVFLMDKGVVTGMDDELYSRAFDTLMELKRYMKKSLE